VEGLAGELDERLVVCLVLEQHQRPDILALQVGEGRAQVVAIVHQAAADHQGAAVGEIGENRAPVVASHDDDLVRPEHLAEPFCHAAPAAGMPV